MKINVAALSYKRACTPWQKAASDVKNSYILAQSLGFQGWWFGKTNNSDHFVYGSDPNIDLGTFLKPLTRKSRNLYIAETKKYKLEYYANTIPTLKLIPKK